MEEKNTKQKSLQNKSYESLGCLLMIGLIVGAIVLEWLHKGGKRENLSGINKNNGENCLQN